MNQSNNSSFITIARFGLIGVGLFLLITMISRASARIADPAMIRGLRVEAAPSPTSQAAALTLGLPMAQSANQMTRQSSAASAADNSVAKSEKPNPPSKPDKTKVDVLAAHIQASHATARQAMSAENN